MLTPLDVDNAKFRGALSGYARGEVEQFRARVIQALEDYIAQIETHRTRIAELEAQLARYRESEELLKNSVVLAQRTADELIAAAHQRADSVIRAAQLEGETVRRSMGELRAQREQFEYEFHGLLSGFIHRLEQANPALRPPAALQTAVIQPLNQIPAGAAPHPPAPEPEAGAQREQTSSRRSESDPPAPAALAAQIAQPGALLAGAAPTAVDAAQSRDADALAFLTALQTAPLPRREPHPGAAIGAETTAPAGLSALKEPLGGSVEEQLDQQRGGENEAQLAE
jgi:cell division initiation protein